jgi:PIN domain nuclease of toxin-antitoxin system
MATSRLLLDTHAFLWWRDDHPNLKDAARDLISSADMVFVSAASAWEVAIKVALGRLKIPASFEAGVVESGFEKLPIHFSHAQAVGRLPPYHRDPFDRMLVAQAMIEDLTLVTHDRRFKKYAVEVAWT